MKSQTLEAELAETKAQLEELKGRQKQLEIRNTLLEKVTQFNQQQPQQPPVEDKDQVTLMLSAMLLLLFKVQGYQVLACPSDPVHNLSCPNRYCSSKGLYATFPQLQ